METMTYPSDVEAIQTKPAQSIIEKVAHDLGPCPECGELYYFTQEQIDAEGFPYCESYPEWAAKCYGGIMHEKCIADKEARERAVSRESEIALFIKRAYDDGYMLKVAKGMTFDKSNREIESRNSVHWNMAKFFPIKNNLWISGGPGLGKTFLARCILNLHLQNHRTAAELPASELALASRGFEDAKKRWIQKWSAPFLLLIDDIDKIAWTAHDIELLYLLVNTRRDANKRIIITSNVDGQKFMHMLVNKLPDNSTASRSIMDRLFPCDKAELSGTSIRRAS